MGGRPGFTVGLLSLALLAGACRDSSGSAAVDPDLARTIAAIRAIDNHAHPMRPAAPGAAADSEFDALPLDGIPPFPVPWRLRAENPEWAEAARALYGLASVSGDTGAAYVAALTAARAAALKEHGDQFPSWVLDQAGIDVMFANRVAMGPGLDAPRFRWVAFDDALLFPLDTRAEAARTPDTRPLYPREAALLKRALRELGLPAIPPTLAGYAESVIGGTLSRQRKAGAVAIKFEAAYLRPLDFGTPAPDSAAAAATYARYARGGVPSASDYRTLENWLFREIARRAGTLGLAVHIHATDEFGGFYSADGAAPHLLEPVVNDPALRGTTFVLIHGGWPRVDETASLLSRPNVYADISMMTLFIEPRQLAGALRRWLSQWPEKVLFGTDAFDGGPAQGWDQGAWLASTSARRALGMALTDMMRDGEITRPRAEELARMVMRENALRLYGLRN
jgi:predicted TIM-barrel fold metal-dependent hydrolase